MTQVAEWSPMVVEKLTATLGDDAPKLITLMKDVGAILSGGFVLNSIVGYEPATKGEGSPDLDIYVPVGNMPRFLGALVSDTLKVESCRHFDATVYCRSFLRKNGIRRVHTFKTVGENYVDVMSVRSRKTLQDVCSNFDLTFCQVWFDGTHVFATHPDHIREKKGFLQKEYIDIFVKGNEFLKRRISKYIERGFTVEYHPDAIATLPPIVDLLLKKQKCITDDREEMMSLWLKRAMNRWLLSSDDWKQKKDGFIIPLGVRTTMDKTNQTFSPGTKKIRDGLYKKIAEFFFLPDDEGYDSESMDTPNLAQIAVAKYRAPVQELASVPFDPTFVLGREMWQMMYKTLATRDIPKNERGYYERIENPNLGELLLHEYNQVDHWKQYVKDIEAGNRKKYVTIERARQLLQEAEQNVIKRMSYIKYIHDHALRIGEDANGIEGPLYDIHTHPMEAAWTQESLEGYFNTFITTLADKSEGVPCYHKPIPFDQANAAVKNCQKRITLKEIQAIVSPEFYKKFTYVAPIKTGLNSNIPLYDITLPNVKVPVPSFGDEYSESMCPFCLKHLDRSEGCSYMTHENPKALAPEHAPFCQSEHVVQPLLEKYKTMARSIDPFAPLRIEICIECGRPCFLHQHFDIRSAAPRLIPIPRKPDPMDPTRTVADYAKCTGGGRAELFARILAVRDVYKKGGIKNPKAERIAAAETADRAAKHPAYLARGKAIADKPPAERKFNTKVPTIKKYDDPAYEDVTEENAHAAILAAQNAAENVAVAAIVKAGTVGGKRRTYKRRRVSKSNQTNLTKKHSESV